MNALDRRIRSRSSSAWSSGVSDRSVSCVAGRSTSIRTAVRPATAAASRQTSACVVVDAVFERTGRSSVGDGRSRRRVRTSRRRFKREDVGVETFNGPFHPVRTRRMVVNDPHERQRLRRPVYLSHVVARQPRIRIVLHDIKERHAVMDSYRLFK